MTAPDTETVSLARVVLAFCVVFALLAAFGIGLKYIKTRGISLPGIHARPTQQRLQIVESLAVDLQRRAVILRCDDKEHLLLLGTDRDIVVEANLKSSPALPPKSSV